MFSNSVVSTDYKNTFSTFVFFSQYLCIKKIQKEFTMSLGKRLKLLRADQSQAAFGDRLGVSQGSIANYERNDRFPDSALIEKICVEFSVTADWLIFGDEGTQKLPTSEVLKRQHAENIELQKNKTADVGASETQEITLLASHVREMSTLLMESGKEIRKLESENASLRYERDQMVHEKARMLNEVQQLTTRVRELEKALGREKP